MKIVQDDRKDEIATSGNENESKGKRAHFGSTVSDQDQKTTEVCLNSIHWNHSKERKNQVSP